MPVSVVLPYKATSMPAQLRAYLHVIYDQRTQLVCGPHALKPKSPLLAGPRRNANKKLTTIIRVADTDQKEMRRAARQGVRDA